MTTQTSPTRPTCGTCPHAQMTQPMYLQFHDERWHKFGVPHVACHVLPPTIAADSNHNPCVVRQPADSATPGCLHHPDMAAYVAAWQRSKRPAHDDSMAHTCGHQEAFGGYALAYCPGHEPDTGCGIEWMACEQCRDNPELLARAQTWLLTHKCRSKETP